MIEPHGNLLVSFPFSEDELQEYSELSNNISSLTLSLKQQCDLEMISNGAFSPLVTFNNQKDYEEILNNNKNTLAFPLLDDVLSRLGHKTIINIEIKYQSKENLK